jgi:hypothetical protein
MAFVRFCFIVPLLYPVAVVLSVSIGVGGCVCPNSSKVVMRMLIPQVRQARKYPNSPWETIHPPGEIMQYVRDPTRSTRMGVPSHSQPLINTKYQIQVTNYLQTIF